MALYLKYRPQNLDELIGQEAVKQILSSASLAGKLSHAYLLVGPRGTGKTSTARILAKMVNCEGKQVPCNKCPTCLSITDGSNLDLIEIDAASNRGIDDIRTLRENIKLSPTSSKKKIYIIDEVHMLTTEAFNALLKTLEEPPKHALFILATTEGLKVPQTILSRVQRLDFKLATPEDLNQTLNKIVKSEKIDIEDGALKALAKKADGSFRDCVKLLDQLASLGKKITLTDVEDCLRSTKFEDLQELLEKIALKNTKESLLIVNKIINSGNDTKELILSLTDILRALMFIKNDLGTNLVQPNYGSDQYKILVELSNKFTMADLSKGLNNLQQSLEKLKYVSIPVLPLELAIVEMCTSNTVISTKGIVGPANARIQLNESQSELDSHLHGSDKIESIVIASEAKQSRKEIATEPLAPRNDKMSPEIALLHEKWTFVLETIRPYNFSLEALLRSAKIVDCSDGVVTLEVPYSFHQRILETPKSKDLLESILSDVLGKSAKVITVLGQRPVRVEDVANVEIAADDEIIRAASEIFEGSLID